MTVQLKRRLITVEEYHKMGEVGILQESGIELINGEIIEMSPIGSKHAATVDKISSLLTIQLEGKAIVRVQNPVVISAFSEPEPDISIVKYRNDFYTNQLPNAEDALLIIEVADTSIEYDREVKLPIYAEAGIPEYWLIDLAGRQVEAYSEPSGKLYKLRRLVSAEDELIAEALELKLPVRTIFEHI